jgi:hypothetical protein
MQIASEVRIFIVVSGVSTQLYGGFSQNDFGRKGRRGKPQNLKMIHLDLDDQTNGLAVTIQFNRE